jgi:hypothetical protein
LLISEPSRDTIEAIDGFSSAGRSRPRCSRNQTSIADWPLNGRGGDNVFTSAAQIRRRLFANMIRDRKY